MATQHFCLFLKKRGIKNPHREVRNDTCIFCPTKLSRHNDGEACFSCQEKLRDRWLGEEGKLAIVEEGKNIEIDFPEKNIQQREGTQVTLWRECRGVCGGNGQTVFGVIDPIARIIRLERTRAISHDGTCGACGGEITLSRDVTPRWAEDFSVLI